MTSPELGDQTEKSAEGVAPQSRATMKWRGLVLSLIINAVFPWIIYTLLKRYTRVSDFTALIATGIPSLLDGVTGIALRRRLDFMAGFTLFTVAVSLALIALGGSPKLYLVRESLFTAAYGVAMLISLLFPRPLGFYTGRYFVAGNAPEQVARFNANWEYPWFREIIRAQTIIWGIGTTVEAAVRISLAYTLPTARFLAVSPLVFYGYMALTFLVSSQSMRRMKARRKQAEAGS